MKLTNLKDIDAGTRSVIIISVAAAYVAWDIGFELGVYGQIFAEKMFLAWTITTSLLIIFLMIPKDRLAVPRSLVIVTAIPTLWLIVALVNRTAVDDVMLRQLMTVLGFIVVLFCLPYVVSIMVSLLYPDFFQIEDNKAIIAIFTVIIFMLLAGFLIGHNHRSFLSCEDFLISGSHVPDNCRPAEVYGG